MVTLPKRRPGMKHKWSMNLTSNIVSIMTRVNLTETADIQFPWSNYYLILFELE